MVLLAVFSLFPDTSPPPPATNTKDECARFSDLSAPVAKDVGGNDIASTNVSQTVIIFSTFSNPCYFDQQVVIVTEVRDQDNNVTAFFQQAPVRAGAFNSSEVGALWAPKDPGRYELRSFAFSNSSTQILTEVQTGELVVVDYELVEISLHPSSKITAAAM